MAIPLSAALERIANVVGSRGVVAPADAAPPLRDERGLYQGRAALVVRPGSASEVAAVRARSAAGLMGCVHEEAVALMRRLEEAVDPRRIMNPGKVLP